MLAVWPPVQTQIGGPSQRWLQPGECSASPSVSPASDHSISILGSQLHLLLPDTACCATCSSGIDEHVDDLEAKKGLLEVVSSSEGKEACSRCAAVQIAYANCETRR
jgi:hypothetical protein